MKISQSLPSILYQLFNPVSMSEFKRKKALMMCPNDLIKEHKKRMACGRSFQSIFILQHQERVTDPIVLVLRGARAT